MGVDEAGQQRATPESITRARCGRRVARARDCRDAPVLDEHRDLLARRRRRAVEQSRVREPGTARRGGRIVEQTGQARRHPGTVSEHL